MTKKLSKREKILGLLELSHKALREAKDQDLEVLEKEESEEEEPEKESPAPTEEKVDLLTAVSSWLFGDDD